MSPKLIRTLTIFTLSALSLALLVTLSVFSVFNQLIADDVSYFRYFDGGQPWHFLYWHYFEHSGRFLQSVFVAVGHTLFGDNSVKVMPLLVYLAFAAAISWAAYRFVPWKSKPVILSILAGVSLSSAAIR